MKNTTLIQIYRYWNELSLKEKIDLLQKFEEENSQFQKRQPREIVVDQSIRDDIGGVFSYDSPEIIKVPDPTKFGGVRISNSITHEGYHAYIYDHMYNKCDLNLYSDIDIDKFYSEKLYNTKLQQLLKIYKDGDILFSLFSMEENLVEKEAALHIIYNLLKSCDNKSEIINISEFYCELMDDFAYRESAKSQYSKKQFDLINAFCEQVVIKNIDHYYTTKKINKNLYPELVKSFDENLMLFLIAKQYPEKLDQMQLGMKVGKNLLNAYDEIEMDK
ncbi:MAG: hypothetical protein IJS74_00435 [Clostridia bacterium]|nr:hypothetical protein [Clostridia bacterium]